MLSTCSCIYHAIYRYEIETLDLKIYDRQTDLKNLFFVPTYIKFTHHNLLGPTLVTITNINEAKVRQIIIPTLSSKPTLRSHRVELHDFLQWNVGITRHFPIAFCC